MKLIKNQLIKDIKENYENFNAKYFAEKYNININKVYHYASKFKVSSNQRWEKYKDQIIKEYLNGISIKNIADKYGHFQGNIKKKLVEWDVLVKNQSQANRKIKINENFFEKIDSHEKAYFLGFIYADGNVYLRPEKSKTVFQISLHNKDSYILKDFLKIMGSEHKLYNERKRPAKKLLINSIKITTDLIKLGVTPKKSFVLNFPTQEMVPEKYINSFILGYFDGDGSVFIYNKKQKYFTKKHEVRTYNSKRWGISIISSRKFCEKMITKIQEHTGLIFKIINDKRHPGISSIRLTSNKENMEYFKKFYKFIYSNSKLFLTRKKEKFHLIFNEL